MKKRKQIFKSVITIVTLIILSLIIPKGTKAALQSNGDAGATLNLEQWMMRIRKMQETGQTLGLTDTINTTNLTSGNKNLDIHMQKNTEYGAMLLLGISQYGNSNKLNTNGVTTTGNNTGIVLKINKEWVAAGTISDSSRYTNASKRYKNIYNSTYAEKIGDAIKTVGKWHGSSTTGWITGDSCNARSGIVRAYSGSVFSYYGTSWIHFSGEALDAHYSAKAWRCRAAVVVGSGV